MRTRLDALSESRSLLARSPPRATSSGPVASCPGASQGAGARECSSATTTRPHLAQPLPSRQLRRSRSFTLTPFRTLSQRTAPSTALQLPPSPQLRRPGSPAALQVWQVLDSQPPSTAGAVQRVRQHLAAYEPAAGVVASLHSGRLSPREWRREVLPAEERVRTRDFSRELGSLAVRWSSRLGATPRAVSVSAQRTQQPASLQQMAPPSSSQPPWAQPKLFSAASYLSPAGQGVAAECARKRLDFKLGGERSSLAVVTASPSGSQGPGMAFQPRQEYQQGRAIEPALREEHSSPHRTWLPTSRHSSPASADHIKQPSLAHVRQITSTAGTQTSPSVSCVPISSGPREEEGHACCRKLQGEREESRVCPSSPHQAWLPPSPGSKHRAWVQEATNPVMLAPTAPAPASPSCLPTGPLPASTHARQSCSPGQLSGCLHSPGCCMPSPATQHPNSPNPVVAATARRAVMASDRVRRPFSAGACLLPVRHLRQPPFSRPRSSGQARVSARAAAMLQVASSDGLCSAAAAAYAPLPASLMLATADAMARAAAAASGEVAAEQQRHCRAAEIYMQRAKDAVAARKAGVLRAGPPMHARAPPVIPGALASKLRMLPPSTDLPPAPKPTPGAQEPAAARVQEVAGERAEPAPECQWQIPAVLLQGLQRARCMLSEDSEAEESKVGPPSRASSRCSSSPSSPECSTALGLAGRHRPLLRLGSARGRISTSPPSSPESNAVEGTAGRQLSRLGSGSSRAEQKAGDPPSRLQLSQYWEVQEIEGAGKPDVLE